MVDAFSSALRPDAMEMYPNCFRRLSDLARTSFLPGEKKIVMTPVNTLQFTVSILGHVYVGTG